MSPSLLLRLFKSFLIFSFGLLILKVIDSKVTQLMNQIGTKDPQDTKLFKKDQTKTPRDIKETQKVQDEVRVVTNDLKAEDIMNETQSDEDKKFLKTGETHTIESAKATEAKDVKNHDMYKTLNIFKERKMQVQNYCSSLQNPPRMVNSSPKQMLVLKERRLVWCPVYKAGTSTWMTYLAQLSTKPNKSPLLEKYHALKLGRMVAPELQFASWKSWLDKIHKDNHQEIKFIMVRHPFERLVSAFRDKLEQSCTE